MALTIPNNFVEKYDQGQKKLVASELDANFDAIETAVNTTVVHLAETETITGDKTFSGTVNVVTPASSDDSTKPATTEWVRENAPSVPVGTIIWSAAASVPAGYLLCNGSAVGRATYPELFAAIGTTFGSGDGSTTFNLPNLIDKFIEGGNTAGTEYQAGLPNITGTVSIHGYGISGGSGSFSVRNSGTTVPTHTYSATGYTYADLNASRSSSIYGASTTVQPPAVTALPCIKAFSSVVGDATVVAGQLVNEIQSKVSLDGSNTSSIGSTLSTYMAHAAMPSEQYESLTCPATGGTVQAPADGWIYFKNNATSGDNGNKSITLTNNDTGFAVRSLVYATGSNVDMKIYLPVRKSEVVKVDYNVSGNAVLIFYYADGTTPIV